MFQPNKLSMALLSRISFMLSGTWKLFNRAVVAGNKSDSLLEWLSDKLIEFTVLETNSEHKQLFLYLNGLLGANPDILAHGVSDKLSILVYSNNPLTSPFVILGCCCPFPQCRMWPFLHPMYLKVHFSILDISGYCPTLIDSLHLVVNWGNGCSLYW